MNKSELIQHLATRTGLSKAQATKAVETLFDTDNGLIVSALREKRTRADQRFWHFRSARA